MNIFSCKEALVNVYCLQVGVPDELYNKRS